MTQVDFLNELCILASEETFYRLKVKRMIEVYNDMIFDDSYSKKQCSEYALRLEDAKESWAHARSLIVKSVSDYYEMSD